MNFNSYSFILLFLPMVILGYYMLNRISIKAGKIVLIVAGVVFYLQAGINMALLLAFSMAFNLLFAKGIYCSKRYRRTLVWVAITCNVGLLFYFKYFDFVAENISHLFKFSYTSQNLILPLGISFFTFQQILYLVNIYRGEINEIDWIDYVAYILYFTKLLMGPIVEPTELISQFNDVSLKKIDWDNISYGIKMFSFGLFKKMVLADTFARAVSWGYANFEAVTSMDCFLIMLFYSFEIYFDFSGYSDMAIGTSLMLNITLPINFDSPYKATSIRDFWRRWHMSLTGFLTKYIYIPLGGNAGGVLRTYINTMIVFLISGIWHGANWTFILWGALHGALSVINRIFDKQQKKLMETIRWGSTFFLVNILWLLFRSDSITQWWDILGIMFSFQNTAVSEGLINSFWLPESDFINNLFHLEGLNITIRGLWTLIFVICGYFICLVPANNYRRLQKNSYITMVLAAIVFVWGFLCLSSESVFVYFNF